MYQCTSVLISVNNKTLKIKLLHTTYPNRFYRRFIKTLVEIYLEKYMKLKASKKHIFYNNYGILDSSQVHVHYYLKVYYDNTCRNLLQFIDSLFMVSFWGHNSSQLLILQAWMDIYIWYLGLVGYVHSIWDFWTRPAITKWGTKKFSWNSHLGMFFISKITSKKLLSCYLGVVGHGTHLYKACKVDEAHVISTYLVESSS